jgi:hypothetical protein
MGNERGDARTLNVNAPPTFTMKWLIRSLRAFSSVSATSMCGCRQAWTASRVEDE